MADSICTIIIPAYNAQESIIPALESVCSADTKRFSLDIIVVDDGSTDNTYEAVSSYAADKEGIFCIRKENGGVSSARNEALLQARTKYIFFLDADDLMMRDSLEEMIDLAQRHNVDAVIASFICRKEGEADIKRDCVLPSDCVLGREEIRDDVLRRFFNGKNTGLVNLWNKLYRTDIIRSHEMTFDEKKTHGEDWHFNITYFEHASSVWVTRTPVLIYRLTQVDYRKYRRNLAYSLIDEYRIAYGLNRTYGFAEEDDEDYLLFMRRSAEKAIAYLRIGECPKEEKSRFLKSEEEQAVFGYLSALDKEKLLFLGFSRKDKIAFRLIKNGAYQSGMRLLDR